MISPARRHFLRRTSGLASSAISTGVKQTGDQYELMAAALWESRRTLKGIKSLEHKIAKKVELIQQFLPYIDGVLEQGKGAQDDVLMTCMVWLMDTGNFSRGLDIAEYALKHDLHTPDQYRRDTASLIAEQVADEALKQLAALPGDTTEKLELTANLYSYLSRVEALIDGRDMHDQIRAKLYKGIGYALREQEDKSKAALDSLHKALQLNDKIGVKKDIEKLQRIVTNQTKDEGSA